MRALLTLYQCVPITTADLCLIDIVDMIAAVAGCFSALKTSRKNLPIVFPISESESERYLFDPHKKFIQSNNKKTFRIRGPLLRPAWSLT